MYKDSSQLRMEDFVFPYGKLDPENDWIKLADLVPWEVAEERYATQFVNNGHPAHPCRMALGALLIQRRLKCSDEWLVKHIGENPYLQYFIGMKEYGPCPFGASTLVAFRNVNLLNQAREKLEHMVDEICKATGERKPRMYRRRARQDFLRLSKSKKRSAKAIRSAVKKQLQYIRRDAGYIVRFVQNGVKLTEKQADRMNLVTTV